MASHLKNRNPPYRIPPPTSLSPLPQKKNLLTPSYVTLPTPFISRGAEAVMGMTIRHHGELPRDIERALVSFGVV